MLIEAIWNRISEVLEIPYWMIGNVGFFDIGECQVRMWWYSHGIEVRYFSQDSTYIRHVEFYRHCFADPSADPEKIVRTVAVGILAKIQLESNKSPNRA